ncbi:MAG: gamma-glutamyltransferase [Chloroflexi bacterium HGW-Chloroflexi-3]|nr:MAG: gamma-glutamyltransferase [Chloroflexi bacterium HGW-Chloroflexi-3]
MDFEFKSKRSPVFGTNGMVASSQPLATAAGVDILRKGGNAASAAVAVAAALNVTEPTSTGIGGDVFILYYSQETSQVYALNGSGRAPFNLSLEKLENEGFQELPPYHPYTITVPGACDAWFTLNERFGNLQMDQILSPAIYLAENGYPVAPITSHFWQSAAKRQLKTGLNGDQLLIEGSGPKPGQIFKNIGLARTFKRLAKNGKNEFYTGEIASAIVDVISTTGGCLSLKDLESHQSDWVEPISVDFRNTRIWECPPNGQGLAALIGLNILKQLDLDSAPKSSPLRYHFQIEAMHLAFSDAWAFISDPEFYSIPLQWLLSEDYARQRSKLINPARSNKEIHHGTPPSTSDTVYFCVVDQTGNACSFINSNYMGFGTGIVPSGFGFSLQNRGHNFSLLRGHPNQLEPHKRPYHTIIPAMATDPNGSQLIGPFGVMGGFMQPQGHLQVACNLFLDQMDPQTALDLPRFCILPESSSHEIALEEGIPIKTMSTLAEMGHVVKPVTGMNRALFGRGQVILRDKEGILAAGSDPRADGCAMTFIST